MKTFAVKAIPGAKQARLVPVSDGSLKVWVKEVAEKGQANQAVMDTLAAYLKVPKSRVILIRGGKNRHKVLGVLDP